MNYATGIPVLILVLLAACASYDGVYSPACIAFAGDTIELNDGLVRWDKFTDQVIVGEQGDIVDQFPGYPLQANYRVDGNQLILTTDAGTPLDTLFLSRHENRAYLLTSEQHKEWQETGNYPECALVLGGRRSDWQIATVIR